MSLLMVDFATRTRIPEDTDIHDLTKVQHPHWCQRNECELLPNGNVTHTRIISRVADVTISVEQYIDGEWESLPSVFVGGPGEIAVTDEQLVILGAAISEAREFVRGLLAEAVAS